MTTTTSHRTDQLDKRMLNLVQSRFPMSERPYHEMAQALGTTESDLIERIAYQKGKNVIRHIAAIFDTRKLGYKTTLVAFQLPPGKLEKGAHHINKLPGVSHNYARNGTYNLWFTLAVPPYEDLNSVIDRLVEETGAEISRIMPTIRFFKIGVNFDMVKNEGAAYEYYSPDGYGKKGSAQEKKPAINNDWNKAVPISDRDIKIIRELQEDLPLIPRPFDAMAERLGMTTGELFDWAAEAEERQIMRRYSAVLYHRKAGFKANAMAVWKVPKERADEVGLKMAESPWVTHCYERPTFPDWQYSHFTMLHAPTKEKCEELAEEISKATGIDEYQMLYSTREYKKTRVRYFVEHEMDEAGATA
ncbi:MAG: Lrp/AsnC family transcriptional regulator [Chloroflexi bacterium]|nr:Lrp/AsnC family transcriptional regulator [Chloroflexota bacterium]